jgi:hypothetical protein
MTPPFISHQQFCYHRRRHADLLQGLGQGEPVVSHGWPLNADAWHDQMYFLASNDFRTIAHVGADMGGRASHGRATTWTRTLTIWPPSSRRWTCVASRWLATRRARRRGHALHGSPWNIACGPRGSRRRDTSIGRDLITASAGGLIRAAFPERRSARKAAARG